MTEAVVECRGVRKKYGKNVALNDLTMTLPASGVVGILGPNGSGKSTLFRMMTGLTRADAGDIKVLGRTPGWRTNRDVAYLPDRARWYPEHTTRHAFQWAERFLPGFNRESAERLAEFMKVGMDARAGGMSRGQEARLMLILCVARDVPLIILDEPFAGIDVMSREQIIGGLIDHLTAGQHTILLSTHEVYEAESLFDYAVFMDEGQVRLAGEADELRREHGSMHNIMQTLYR